MRFLLVFLVALAFSLSGCKEKVPDLPVNMRGIVYARQGSNDKIYQVTITQVDDDLAMFTRRKGDPRTVEPITSTFPKRTFDSLWERLAGFEEFKADPDAAKGRISLKSYHIITVTHMKGIPKKKLEKMEVSCYLIPGGKETEDFKEWVLAAINLENATL